MTTLGYIAAAWGLLAVGGTIGFFVAAILHAGKNQ